ncbi:hypothetical protein Q5P01_024080 [Channa striata]|uniref:Uncharacterized protein n=1 Tax=Channa striata TaxID=64152 RepID=A0AA88IZ78_CHASR|nr:hypothetical protein Q5P01_024080 [Channa striata]
MFGRLHLLGQTSHRGKVTAAQQEASHLRSFRVSGFSATSLPASVCPLSAVSGSVPEQSCTITASSAGSLPLQSTLHNQVELPLQLLTTLRQDLGASPGSQAFRLLDGSSAGNYNEGFGFCCSVPESFLESGKSLHPPARLIIQTIIFYPPLAAGGEAEGIPSRGAPELSITFQLANELHHQGSSWSEGRQSQPEELSQHYGNEIN